MGLIKGITVTLVDRQKSGVDGFNHPVYDETEVTVDNVLVAPVNTDDVTSKTNLSGKEAKYVLAIPKSDNHEWTGCKVRFFGHTWKVVGFPLRGIEDLIPLDWNRKVTVELYE